MSTPGYALCFMCTSFICFHAFNRYIFLESHLFKMYQPKVAAGNYVRPFIITNDSDSWVEEWAILRYNLKSYQLPVVGKTLHGSYCRPRRRLPRKSQLELNLLLLVVNPVSFLLVASLQAGNAVSCKWREVEWAVWNCRTLFTFSKLVFLLPALMQSGYKVWCPRARSQLIVLLKILPVSMINRCFLRNCPSCTLNHKAHHSAWTKVSDILSVSGGTM